MWTTFLSAPSHRISIGNFISLIQKLRIRGASYGNSIPSLDWRVSFIERPFVCSSAVSATSACSMTSLIVMLTLLGSDLVFASSEFNRSPSPKTSLDRRLKKETAKRTTDKNTISVLKSRTVLNLCKRPNFINAPCSRWAI